MTKEIRDTIQSICQWDLTTGPPALVNQSAFHVNSTPYIFLSVLLSRNSRANLKSSVRQILVINQRVMVFSVRHIEVGG